MRDILIYTVHKAASMFLHKLTLNITKELGIAFYSPNAVGTVGYGDEIKRRSWKAFIEDESRSGCFGPIRAGEAEPIFPDDIGSYAVILHLRDPRDALTSAYFSSTYSHTRSERSFNPSDDLRRQWEEQGVDAFVLERAPKLSQRYAELCATLLGRPNVVFVRYEDMVADYHTWLGRYLSAFSQISAEKKAGLGLLRKSKDPLERMQETFYEKFKDDFLVEEEDVFRHKRQITPGDYQRKLSQETVAQLNREFGAVLGQLGYGALTTDH
ncbi:MAG: sulfotransferase [Caldilineales bacterium]|nr:sulfotransferase [Caldilineales bacterium]